MNRAVSRVFGLSRRVVQQQSKRNGSHGHDIVNPGPNITLDYMPVPFQPYQQVYGELQSKFNMYLGVSAVAFVAAFALACYEDVFCFEALRPPQSYRNRK